MNTPKETAEKLWDLAHSKIDVDISGATQVVLFTIATIITEYKIYVPEPYKFRYKFWEEVKKEILK